MKIFIIEDEIPAYKRLSKLISELHPEAQIAAQIDSIAGLKRKMEDNDIPDVAFMDIHLSDGTALELLETEDFNFPVIFTTAYTEYSLQAFKALSIDYILKPVKKTDIERAFQSLSRYEQVFRKKNMPSVSGGPYKKRFIVRYGENIKTISVEEIAYFVSKHKGTIAKTFDGRTYPIDYNLESLTDIMDPEFFFRVNRQFLIGINSITEMKSYSKARVIIKLKPEYDEDPVVSSERAAAFKKWLGGEI